MHRSRPCPSLPSTIARQLRRAIVAGAFAGSAVLVSACGSSVATSPPGPGCHAAGTCRVLFVGNSYTYDNDLPAVFADLAAAGGHRVKAAALVDGGATLADHVESPETSDTLESTRWSVVVLQEQSEIPSSPQLRRSEMYPAARQLVATIRGAKALPLFFVTWAHRKGWPAAGLAGYGPMQSAVDEGYRAIARQLHVPVAPVGSAWSAALARGSAALWQADGSHPTLRGTYLAACVFYASIFGESPQGLPYDAGLPARLASKLQRIAALSASLPAGE